MTEPRTPPPHDPGTCADCFFSEQDSGGNWRCHRSCPTGMEAAASWPIVSADDWCGFGFYNGSYYTPDGARP